VLARLTRDGGTLYLLLAIYFAVNAALRIALSGSLEMEESRLVFLAQWLVPGYGGQAPLAVWMLHGATRLIAADLLAVIALENLLLFLAYAFVGWAAFEVIRNRALAITAVLGMVLLPQVVYEAQRDGGASAAALMAAAFFTGAFFAMLHRGSLFGHLLAGLGIGAGLLANYDFALLLVVTLIATLLEPAFRARLVNWRIIVTMAAAGAVLVLHALWLRDNLAPVVAETVARIPHHAAADRMSQVIEGLFSLAAVLVGFFAPTLLVFWIAFGRRFPESWPASSAWTRLVGRIFLLVLVALIALVVFGRASAIHDRWLLPFFFLTPLYFSLKLDALNQTIANAPRRFGMVAVLVLIAVPAVLAIRVPAAAWTGRYTKINLPYRPAIDAILTAAGHPPSLILAEDAELGGNLRLGARNIPVIVPGRSSFENGRGFDGRRPLLVVWRAGADGETPLPEPLAHLLASEIGAGTGTAEPDSVTLPYFYGRAGDVYRLAYIWL
jgi:4-amino-4-deoxy-L-arabinose transferase-like glycosyltransferase